jgi:hypothetical protein
MPTLSPYKHRELKRGADDLLPGEAPKKHRSLVSCADLSSVLPQHSLPRGVARCAAR